MKELNEAWIDFINEVARTYKIDKLIRYLGSRLNHLKAFLIAIVLLITILSLFGCSDSENDCIIQRNSIIDRHEVLINQARELGDSYQVHLLIDQRNKQLSELGC
jgi:hypothetical protein